MFETIPAQEIIAINIRIIQIGMVNQIDMSPDIFLPILITPNPNIENPNATIDTNIPISKSIKSIRLQIFYNIS